MATFETTLTNAAGNESDLSEPHAGKYAVTCFFAVLLGLLSGCYGDSWVMVDGVVSDGNSAPIEGAKVRLESKTESLHCEPDECVSDRDGKFHVSGTFAPPGSIVVKFRLSVTKAGYSEKDEFLEGTGTFSRRFELSPDEETVPDDEQSAGSAKR